MERLSIKEIIDHCNRKVIWWEKLIPREKFENRDISDSGCREYREHRQVAEYLNELQKYRQLEEQELLLRLPCKVGDSVWLLFADGYIEEHTVYSIRIGNTVDNICFENGSYYTVWDKDYKSINKWFLQPENKPKQH